MINIKEFYDKIGENYEETKKRLCNDDMISRFVLMFLKDGTYAELENSLERKDVFSSFRAAHTLKGIAANLGFNKLAKAASALTEILRGGALPEDSESLKNVSVEYERIMLAGK